MLYILFGIESKDMLVQIYVAQLIQNHLLKFPPPPTAPLPDCLEIQSDSYLLEQ